MRVGKAAIFALALSILMLLVSVLPVTASPAAGAPLDWTASPPIHVKPYTTSSPTGYSPAQIRHAYGFDTLADDGSGQTIAIIDAYDDPTVESDLQTFINQFGLASMTFGTPGSTTPPTTSPWFQRVYAQGSQPRTDGGWALEISLDVQWAHAIAPGANILLVEAATSSLSNLISAVDLAVSMGADVVSMSWGSSEFSSESSYDSHFNKPGIVFTAASGDSGAGVIYPASSPYVLGVGGTTLTLDSNNAVVSETAWSGSGGGPSAYENEPGYQTGYGITITGNNRGVPDVSYNADPNTGFSVYDSTRYNGQTGWWQVGGTSAGAPQWAALVAIVDEARGSGGTLSTSDLASSPFYDAANGTDYSTDYRDITSGNNGSNGYSAGTGYDLVTGLGSPLAGGLEAYLDKYSVPPPSQALSLSIATDKGSYKAGQQATITFTVTSGGAPFSLGASISGTIAGPSFSMAFSAGPTDASGLAQFLFDTSGKPRGSYTVTATATYNSYTPGSGSDTFRIH